ncbi:response regulator [Eubacterium ramulus]|jgi:response regulator (cheY-like receiver domain and DNA-binding HTH domain)|uniref:Stage 0 sporulation protein A homolog n=1 Tax=Eubacterium ramulus TaxID=39490 RepID=A0A2V1JWA4_EUBRA|nr:response regulator transcription factor [Eubacterium ramulus]PWE87663.1 response regulator [Eubacterium ramulus]
MQRILIIEDDAAIAHLMESTLRREQYNTIWAADGVQGADLFETGHFDLILLDLMLPGISGFELLEYFVPSKVPVIIISAMGQVENRIKGLKMGADDFLVKPFQIGELLARVESVLRRTGKKETTFSCEEVTVDCDSRVVLKNGQEVELTAKEFDLLTVLIRNRNVALSRCFLYESVWQEEYTGETRTLDNHIQRLRKKLGWNDKIQTVFRIGYRLKM